MRFKMVVVLSFLGLLVSAANASDPLRPTFIRRAGATNPEWVAASSLTDEAGHVTWSGLTPDMSDSIRLGSLQSRHLRTDGPCPQAITRSDGPATATSPDNIISAAPAIYRGRVLTTIPGFDGTAPATLLVVQVSKVLRTSHNFPAGGIVYVSYWGADFTLGGERFCNAGFHNYEPAKGDELLILAYTPPSDETARFLPTQPEHLIFEATGRLIASNRLGSRVLGSAISLNSVERLVSSGKVGGEQ